MQDLDRITFTQKADIRKADSNFQKVKDAVDNVESLISSENTRATNAESTLNQQINAAGHKINVSMGSTNFVLTIALLDKNNTTIDTKSVDLPLEEMVVNASYDSTNKKLILTLKNGQEIEVPISGVISGLVSNTRKVGSNNLSADITKSQLLNDIKDETGELKNKTINVNNNTLTNLKVTNFTIKDVSIPITGWSTARTGVYKRAFTISGMKATDTPFIFLNPGDNYTIADVTQNKKDYNNFLSYACTANTLTIFTSKIPEKALKIYVLGGS